MKKFKFKKRKTRYKYRVDLLEVDDEFFHKWPENFRISSALPLDVSDDSLYDALTDKGRDLYFWLYENKVDFKVFIVDDFEIRDDNNFDPILHSFRFIDKDMAVMFKLTWG